MYLGGARLFLGAFVFVFWLGVSIYLILLAGRLVGAVDRIANALEAQNQK